MSYLESMLGKTVELEISGMHRLAGILIDFGLDVVVIFEGVDYMYIPLGHIQNIRIVPPTPKTIYVPEPNYPQIQTENELSYRKILLEAKGMFTQIYVSGNQSIHGYVTNVLTDYFVFFSPVHKTLFIPMFHLKWLIPYPENQTPYTVNIEALSVSSSSIKLARTFEEQLKKWEKHIVVFDLGSNPEKIGYLKSIQNHMVELMIANQNPLYWNIHHLKVVHFPHL